MPQHRHGTTDRLRMRWEGREKGCRILLTQEMIKRFKDKNRKVFFDNVVITLTITMTFWFYWKVCSKRQTYRQTDNRVHPVGYQNQWLSVTSHSISIPLLLLLIAISLKYDLLHPFVRFGRATGYTRFVSFPPRFDATRTCYSQAITISAVVRHPTQRHIWQIIILLSLEK